MRWSAWLWCGSKQSRRARSSLSEAHSIECGLPPPSPAPLRQASIVSRLRGINPSHAAVPISSAESRLAREEARDFLRSACPASAGAASSREINSSFCIPRAAGSSLMHSLHGTQRTGLCAAEKPLSAVPFQHCALQVYRSRPSQYCRRISTTSLLGCVRKMRRTASAAHSTSHVASP